MAQAGNGLAVISGASHGIGFALGQHLAQSGFDLVVNARSAKGLEDLARRVSAFGRETTVVPGDIRRQEVLDGVCAAVADRGVDLLAVCTGALVDPDTEGSALDLDRDRLREVFQTTAEAPIELFRSLSPSLGRAGGRVILVASDWALPGSHGPSVFSAAKAALLQFARTERRLSSGRGIQISVLVLGDVATFDDDWNEPIWTLDDSTEAVWNAFGGSRISLHEVMSAIDLMLTCRTGRVDEIYLTPVDPSYDY